LLLGTAALAALLVYSVAGFFRLSRDARHLRDSFLESKALKWDERIELSVGPVTTYLVRKGLSFAELDPDAQAALEAIRHAEVGLYRLHSARTGLDCASVLSECDEVMARRDWERLVGVIADGQVVAVYVPKSNFNSRDMKACAAVLHGRDLVIVSARSNLEPLLELALRHADMEELRL
jgi:hypothetical protein